MTIEVYAVYPEGRYLVATTNDADHGMDLAERVCRELSHWPYAFMAGGRGMAFKGNTYTLDDLKRRVKD